MEQAIILGLCGPAKVGKSTTAHLIKKKLFHEGYPCVILSFAEPVKEIAAYFGWDGRKDERGRKLLQQIGTDVGRTYNPDIWVNRWLQRATSFKEQGVSVLADDVRFANEAEAIRGIGGFCLRLDPGSRVIDGLSGELGQHVSENPNAVSVDGVIDASQSENNVCDAVLAALGGLYA